MDNNPVNTTFRFASRDLEAFPDDGKRYEIIDGELYVSRQPHFCHQVVCLNVAMKLQQWSAQTGLGRAVAAPGLIFADDDDVAPDVIWIGNQRLGKALGTDGKLHTAPELIIEVLSPGSANERRDREAKLKLYSRRGVEEYWIVDWRRRQVDVFSRTVEGLIPTAVLSGADLLSSPLLPEFSCPVSDFFEGVPAEKQESDRRTIQE
jgi:Uma2 family endonuclease